MLVETVVIVAFDFLELGQGISQAWVVISLLAGQPVMVAFLIKGVVLTIGFIWW